MLKLYDFLPYYPEVKDKNFNQKIYDKKEFYDEKLSEYPDFPKKRGEYLRHQKIISRFLSSHTPYKGLLLFHEMGTGKTCATIAATELIKKQGGYKGVLYLAPGQALINNFKQELAFKCTDGDYIPENYDNIIGVKKRTQKLNKQIKTFYTTNTYETFAKKPNPKFDNHIIVMDEVHNITSENNTTYEPILKFAQNCKNCKILLLSGTPMKDSGKEIFNVMNLILPRDQTITKEKMNRCIVNGELKKEGEILLKNAFRGRTSYLKSKSRIKKETMGRVLPKFKFIKLFDLEMEKTQREIYVQNLEEEEVQNFDTKPRQISLSVYPDKTYGSAGFKKYIKIGRSGKGYVLKNFFPKGFDSFSEKKKLAFIRTLSVKYAKTIELILKARKENKIIFVYNEFVEGSGLVLFSLLLRKFGFRKASKTKDVEKRERYLLLTGEELNKNKTKSKKLLEILNSDENSDGSLIRVILGSQVVSEGLTFKNVQIEVVQTPHWNFSRIFQAIARGYRIGSHKALLEKGFDPTLEIYLLVSTIENTETIDVKMYNIAERKDILVKRIERVLMESSFDCQLNKERNITNSENGSRDCEYRDCNYVCDGIGNTIVEDLDLSTYNLYYNSNELEEYIEKIKKLFTENFSLTFDQIKKKIKTKNTAALLQSLSLVINRNMVLYNRYGLKSYLFEDNDLYYLGNDLESICFLDGYYNKHPYVKINNLYENVLRKTIGNPILKRMCKKTDSEEITKDFLTLDKEIANYFIEQSNSNKLQNNPVMKTIRAISKDYIYSVDERKYNLFLAPTKVSYLQNKDWVVLSGEEILLDRGYGELILELYEKFQNLDWFNPHNFYFSLEKTGERDVYRLVKSYEVGDKVDFLDENEKEVKGKIEKIEKKDSSITVKGKKYELNDITMKKHKINKGQDLDTVKIDVLINVCMGIDFEKLKLKKYIEFVKEVEKGTIKIPEKYADKSVKWAFLNSKKIFKGVTSKKITKLKRKDLQGIIIDFIKTDPKIDGVSLTQNYSILNLIKSSM
jgi:succinate dehydrogenase flavin-adding protein (antitoxin of CptAB toxin-antitoxin module)